MKLTYFRPVLLGLILESTMSATAHAGAPAHAPVLVTIPQFNGGFELNASLLYLQASSSSLNYSILTSPLPATTPNWHINVLQPHYHAGFNIGLGYIFDHTGNDLQLSWTHSTFGKSASVAASPTQFVGPYYEIGPNAASLDAVQGQTKFYYDVINFDAGQFVNFGPRLQTRLFAGVDYLHIKQKLYTTFEDTDPSFLTISDNVSDFKGGGPRLGIEGKYDLCYGFGVVAQAAGSASIGRVKSRMDFTSTSAALSVLGIPQNIQAITSDHETRIVPGGEAKLGLSYFFQMRQSWQFTLEAGYQVASYMNAIREVYPQALANSLQTGTTAVATMDEKQSYFGVGGPYLTFAINT